MFIEVNTVNNKIIINSDLIENVYRDNSRNKTVLTSSDKTRLFIEESYEEIKAMLMPNPIAVIDVKINWLEERIEDYINDNRLLSFLMSFGIKKIKDLRGKKASDFLKVTGFGETSMRRLKNFLYEIKLHDLMIMDA